VLNLVYQTPNVASGALGALANDWQISGIYRWTSGRPYNIAFNIPGIGAANLTGTDGNPNARVVLTCGPGSGWSSDPYRQINTSCFAPPQPGQRRRGIGAVLPARAADQTTSTSHCPRRSGFVGTSGPKCASICSTR
jgi:hypothetical protein